MVDILGAGRQIAVCREMTKVHEEMWRGTLVEAFVEWDRREPRGEFTLVVAGAAPPPAWAEAQVAAALSEIMANGISSKEAVRQVTDQSGWPKRAVYAVAQQMKTS